MRFRRFVAIGLLVIASSCNGCASEIVHDVVAVGSVKFTIKRISGQRFFSIDQGDSKDSATAQSGFLCTKHNAVC